MSVFETVLCCLVIPIAYILIYIAGKYDILRLVCEMLKETCERYTEYEEEFSRLRKRPQVIKITTICFTSEEEGESSTQFDTQNTNELMELFYVFLRENDLTLKSVDCIDYEEEGAYENQT